MTVSDIAASRRARILYNDCRNFTPVPGVYDGKGKSLCTAKDYGDMEMYVDWKILPKGDSGIYLRGTPQVQIWDTDLKNGVSPHHEWSTSTPGPVPDVGTTT